jgi:TPR repeat protein
MVADSSGAEELASAEKYLNGTPRNSREAAPWLWKAVGKGNVAATISLSDLYLRGDGVTKSCDQARLLLDAAARKGGRAAGERLRNLQAFGCN